MHCRFYLIALFALCAVFSISVYGWPRGPIIDPHDDIDWRAFGAVSPEELAMTAQALEDNCLMVVSITEDIETPGHYVLLTRHIEDCEIAP